MHGKSRTTLYLTGWIDLVLRDDLEGCIYHVLWPGVVRTHTPRLITGVGRTHLPRLTTRVWRSHCLVSSRGSEGHTTSSRHRDRKDTLTTSRHRGWKDTLPRLVPRGCKDVCTSSRHRGRKDTLPRLTTEVGMTHTPRLITGVGRRNVPRLVTTNLNRHPSPTDTSKFSTIINLRLESPSTLRNLTKSYRAERGLKRLFIYFNS